VIEAVLPGLRRADQQPGRAPALVFFSDRLAVSLREQGYSAQEVDAVLALQPARLGEVPRRLAAVRAFAALPESTALAAANKRVGNILKKADAAVEAKVDAALLKEAAEQALCMNCTADRGACGPDRVRAGRLHGVPAGAGSLAHAGGRLL
jgi:glycyl-tRNA synthetase beta chain